MADGLPDDTECGPRLYCAPCELTWRSIAGPDCFCCNRPGVLGRRSAPPEGWPRVEGASQAVEPR